MTVEAGGLDLQLAFREVGEATEKDVDVSFDVDADGEHAYYVRIVQEDGDMAWSSPIFVA